MAATQPSTGTPEGVAVETCDVCIVGAGIAGLNALFVASRYLSPGQKVILLDRRARVGGMWVDTYPYVRLHQPHPMFTAGNIKWTLGKDRSYLATKGEVLDHPRTLRQRDQGAGAGRRVLRLGHGIRRGNRRGGADLLQVLRRPGSGGRGEETDQGVWDSSHAQRPTRDLQRPCPIRFSGLLRRPIGRHEGARHPGLDHRRR